MPADQNIHITKFKAKAKSLLKSVQARDASALKTIEPYFKPDEFKLTQAQLVVARIHHCVSWKDLIDKINIGLCSFCNKSALDVKLLIEGGCPSRPHSPKDCVMICDECIESFAKLRAERIEE